MLFPAYYWNWPEMHILISEHRDGELITQVIKRLGFSVVRGSTTRGGARALREMSLRIDRGHLCVTPDGPRGPRRSVHQGIAYLGSRTGLPIVGAGMAFKKPWRAKSWDRFACRDHSARPRASCRRPSSSRPTPTATRSRRAASKSSGACRQRCSKPRRGSKSFDREHNFSIRACLDFESSSKVRVPFQALASGAVRACMSVRAEGQP